MKKLFCSLMAVVFLLSGAATAAQSEDTYFPITFYSDPVVDGHTYNLINSYSHQYLQAQSDGDPSELKQSDFPLAQLQLRDFRFSFAGQDSLGAYYSIIPAANEKSRLDVDNASNKNAAKVKLFKQNELFPQAQAFRFLDNGDQTYRIQPLLSNSKVLEVAGPSMDETAPIQLWDYVGAENQKWILIDKDKNAEPPFEAFSVALSSPSGTTQFTVRLSNNSGNEISYGLEAFALERFNGISWESGRYFRPAYGEIGFVFLPNSVRFERLSFYADSKLTPLPEGKYRVVFKTAYSEPGYAEFEINSKSSYS